MKRIITALLLIVLCFSLAGCAGGTAPAAESKETASAAESKKEEAQQTKVIVTPTEASQISLSQYTDPDDRFTVNIPEGWEVSAALLPDMAFGIHVYKPDESAGPKYHAFYILKFELMYSPEMKDFEVSNFGSYPIYDILTEAVAIDSPTVSAMYSKFNDIVDYMVKYEEGYDNFYLPRLNNFTPIEEFPLNSSIASVALDDKIIRANYEDVFDSSLQQGLFAGSLVTAALGDGSYSAYNVMGIAAPDAEFIEYEPILSEILNSIQFSDEFSNQIISATNASYENARQIGEQLTATMEACNDAWFARQETYDIISQKQSDATLGYERVYDTDTGEIYKAPNGFTDVYDGTLYKPITDDMYTSPISGYIE